MKPRLFRKPYRSELETAFSCGPVATVKAGLIPGSSETHLPLPGADNSHSCIYFAFLALQIPLLSLGCTIGAGGRPNPTPVFPTSWLGEGLQERRRHGVRSERPAPPSGRTQITGSKEAQVGADAVAQPPLLSSPARPTLGPKSL